MGLVFDVNNPFRHPRMTKDPEPGDIALVYFSASTTDIWRNGATANHPGLGFNLYGAVRIAKQ